MKVCNKSLNHTFPSASSIKVFKNKGTSPTIKHVSKETILSTPFLQHAKSDLFSTSTSYLNSRNSNEVERMPTTSS
jgi:hypothetical protein